MTRGRGIKRSWGGRGDMYNKGGGGNLQLPNTSQEDISEPSTPTSQQNVGAEQATPEQTLASFGSNNPQARQDTLGGIKSLKVNGDTFCPHEAVRDVALAFKKSFTGSWHCYETNGSMTLSLQKSMTNVSVIHHVQEKNYLNFLVCQIYGELHVLKKTEKLVKNSFTKIIKEKVGETSTLRNEEGFEVDDGDMEKNTTTNGEEDSEDNDVNLLKTILEEQLLKTYSSNANCASSSAPNPPNISTQQIFETPEFQQLLERVLDQRMANMQKYMQAEVNVVVRAAMARILGFTPQPPSDGSCSPPNKS
ncbi:hypothetical protein K7X08_009055 [Anisodus acutangulus]|uniref:Uncharacterized protein n=1 Tax=Anisodus acutangulus TaxID=402998 RepID=A0A9Q1N4K2_9SOLA|nr:hypothetical protein K7X08_009055 [Anisodus acutangulus]